MTRTDSRLALALTLSMLTHLLPLLPELLSSAEPPPAPVSPPLQAMLRPLPAQPALMLPEPQPEAAPKPPTTHQAPVRGAKGQPPVANARNWQQEVRRQFARQQQRGEFYPAEAIARGLQGEALVLLMLDANGNVVAARVEQSSGHRLLDDAALDAVRALRSLPADAPQETLLPVRFRLD